MLDKLILYTRLDSNDHPSAVTPPLRTSRLHLQSQTLDLPKEMEKNLRKSKKIQIYVENFSFITIQHKVCMHTTQENWKIFFGYPFSYKIFDPIQYIHPHTYTERNSAESILYTPCPYHTAQCSVTFPFSSSYCTARMCVSASSNRQGCLVYVLMAVCYVMWNIQGGWWCVVYMWNNNNTQIGLFNILTRKYKNKEHITYYKLYGYIHSLYNFCIRIFKQIG